MNKKTKRIIGVGAIIVGGYLFLKNRVRATSESPFVPPAKLPVQQPSLTLTARLPNGRTESLNFVPVEGTLAPFPDGTVVDVPGLVLADGYFVFNGKWALNQRVFITDPLSPIQ